MDPVNITALLTAKGTPKHFWKLDGKMIVEYPILAGSKSKLVTHRYCASDHDTILFHGNQEWYDPIKMPEKYTKASTQHIDYINYAVSQMQQEPDILVVILGNNVCIKPEWIDECVEWAQSSNAWSAIVPVYKDNDHHPWRARMIIDDCLEPYFEDDIEVSTNRQDLKDNYFLCHNFWVLKHHMSRAEGSPPWSFMGPRVRPHFIDDYGTQDIHEKEDLIRATEWVRTNA
jgi:CMP-N,N'-diacetyllegionaminic acid synthase